MKKAILVLLVGLFWCNIGHAAQYKSTVKHTLTGKYFVGTASSEVASQFNALTKCRKVYRSSKSKCILLKTVNVQSEAQEKLDELKKLGYKKTSHEGKTALSNIWNL